MILIKLRFLAGRFHATPWGRHVNVSEVEWPPSPWRLLRSLVATFYRARPAGVSEEQLRRIVGVLAAPPSFHLPPTATAHTRHYDQASGTPKRNSDGSWKQVNVPFFFDTFVVIDPRAEVLCVWPEAELSEEDTQALAALLGALGTFGRAESWCEAELSEQAEAARLNCSPLSDGQTLKGLEPVRVLLPEEGGEALFERLLIETSGMRKEKKLDPAGSRWVTYARRADAFRARKAAPTRRAPVDTKPTVARYALYSTVLPLVQDALPFAEQVRRALIRNRADTEHSEAITGKTAEGVPLEGHAHAHYLPTDEDGDGRLDHITVYAPRGFVAEDKAALGALRTIYRKGNRPEVRLVLAGLGAAEDFAGEAPLFESARRWRSVTPFSLPRFATRGAGKPARPRDLPESQLMRELRARGLPEPVSITRVEGYSVRDRPLVRWLEFQARRFKGEEGHGRAGFELEFTENVPGPLALGFACHFGLGLFMPV